MDMARFVVETDECEGNSRIVKEADEIDGAMHCKEN